MGQTIYQILPSSLQLQPDSSFWLWLHKSNSFHSGLSKLISASSQSFSQDFPVIKVAIFDDDARIINDISIDSTWQVICLPIIMRQAKIESIVALFDQWSPFEGEHAFAET